MSSRRLRVSWLTTLALVLAVGFGSSSIPASAQSGSKTFTETGKTVNGRFLQYWETHGGLAQQGFPISNELGEVSDTDGKLYTVQYFERAVFEYHPENPVPNDVLLSLLGSIRYKAKYPGGAPNQTPNRTSGAVLFKETGKYLGGLFLQYWQSHGGLVQQGFPITDEFEEKSDLDGKTYRVQYFERAVFEMHPENPSPHNVLLAQVGTFRYAEKSSAGWVAPPYPVPPAVAAAQPTPKPAAPQPTAAPKPPTPAPAPAPAGSGKVIISSIFYDGAESRTEGDEYVVVKNTGAGAVDLAGYRINAGDPGQNFTFPSHVLQPGAEVRVYTNRSIPGSYSFGRESAIWNNGGDCGYLFNPQGEQVDEYCY
jgi:hypothetical protein